MSNLDSRRWKQKFVATLMDGQIMSRVQAWQLAKYLWAERPNLRAFDATDVASIFTERQSELLGAQNRCIEPSDGREAIKLQLTVQAGFSASPGSPQRLWFGAAPKPNMADNRDWFIFRCWLPM